MKTRKKENKLQIYIFKGTRKWWKEWRPDELKFQRQKIPRELSNNGGVSHEHKGTSHFWKTLRIRLGIDTETPQLKTESNGASGSHTDWLLDGNLRNQTHDPAGFLPGTDAMLVVVYLLAHGAYETESLINTKYLLDF